jgi:hypothetical protein
MAPPGAGFQLRGATERDEPGTFIFERQDSRMESSSAVLWPAILGSLSLRRSPCIHANCAACLSGEQHPSHVLYGRHNGRRFAVYVPEDLVGEVRRAVENGRALQDLLVQAGPRYVKALKRARASAAKNQKS